MEPSDYHIQDRINFIESIMQQYGQELAALKEKKKQSHNAKITSFINGMPSGCVLVFDKKMSGRVYTYAITKAPYAWYSTGQINSRRNPSSADIVNFISTGNVKEIHCVDIHSPVNNQILSLA